MREETRAAAPEEAGRTHSGHRAAAFLARDRDGVTAADPASPEWRRALESGGILRLEAASGGPAGVPGTEAVSGGVKGASEPDAFSGLADPGGGPTDLHCGMAGEVWDMLARLYELYEFSDSVCVLSRRAQCGSLLSYVENGLLTWEEMAAALRGPGASARNAADDDTPYPRAAEGGPAEQRAADRDSTI